MTRLSSDLRPRFTFNFSRHVASLLLLLLLISCAAFGQSTTAIDGYTPSALTPGAPAGSYALSGFENVNLFNGKLNFNLPLLTVGGRGTISRQITRPVEMNWVVEHFYEPSGQVYSYFPMDAAVKDDLFGQDYSAGLLKARYATFGTKTCKLGGTVNVTAFTKTLTRLTFRVPGGTQYELRDQLTDGAVNTVVTVPCPDPAVHYNRGKVFVTSDGTSVTFISDTDITEPVATYDPTSSPWEPPYPSGYLLLPDGTRYRIDNGGVSWMTDRNGNKITGLTDPLNRTVTITSSPEQIKYDGFGGADRTISVTYAPLANALRAGYSPQTEKQLFPELDGSSSTNFNPSVIRTITLPNLKSYTLSYNSYGELARVVLPTGGAIEYDWAAGLTNGNTSGTINFGLMFGSGAMDWQIYRRVVERRTYANGTTLESRTTFSRPETLTTDATGKPAVATLGYIVVDQMDAASALLTRQKHYFYGSAGESLKNTGVDAPLRYTDWKEGREWKTEEFDDDGTTILRRVEHTWQQPALGSVWPNNLTTAGGKSNNPQITQTVKTLVDANKVSKQTFTYDQYSNQTDIYEYDYGNGVAGPLVRRTKTTYLTSNAVGGTTYDYDTDTSIYLRSLPEQTSVYNAASVEQARTKFEYDNYTATAPHAALTARTNISGLDPAYTTTKKTRGNVTAVTRYLLNSGGTVTGSISTYQQYDVAGNVTKEIDGENNATSFTFADSFGVPDADARINSGPPELVTQTGTQQSYAYASIVTNAMNQKFYVQCDYYTGKVVDGEDRNGVTSSFYYEDTLDRPTKVIGAANDLTQALTSQKTFTYDDTAHVITTTADFDSLNDTTPLKNQIVYDGMGRTIETRQYETATAYIMMKRTYDALGRVNKVSNPYRTGTPSWTETDYDALGRVVSVTTLADNAAVTTSYSGDTVTVTDQAGKDRQSTTDALGRLVKIVEDPGTSGLGYVTDYAYDPLDNLKTVTQGTLTRTFTYDSLSRLVTAVNPESGTIQYKYDANGNLVLKIDPRSGGTSLLNCSIPYVGTNIATCYDYDALNRVTKKDYGDTTPDVNYYYDAQPLPTGAPSFARGASTGRLVAVTTGGTNAGNYYGYDGLGRVLKRIQRADSVNYVSEATYNKAGGMVTETRPAVPGAADRRTITYDYDGAGRLLSLNSDATTYAAGASVSVTGISYAPHGALDKETLGNGLTHDINYNTRLQPTQIRLGTTTVPTSVLDLTYNYGTTANNDNVLDVTEKIGTWTRKQVYTYDELNRLDKTEENNGVTTTPLWTEDNAYDRFGNRWEVISGGTPLTFNNKNQIVGYTYDLAGNLTDDTVRTYGYDAENRLKAVDTVTNAFTYDGEGKRVKKDFPLQERVRFVYGVGGQLIMEFNLANGTLKKEYIYGADGLLATVDPAAGTKYATSDHLGSPRVVTDDQGGNPSRHDYRPFGRELTVSEGGRTAAQGFDVEDGIKQQFTSKERDDETGLDYFLARYYSSSTGRFTSPDEFTGGPEELYEFDGMIGHNPTFYADLETPQSLNKYQYCLNNPLRFIDPDGHQERTSDRLKSAAGGTASDVVDFVGGALRGISASATYGAVGAPREDDTVPNRIGQVVGTCAAAAAGACLTIGGGGLTIGSGGAAAEVSVPAAAAGVNLLVGATINAAKLATTPINMQRNTTSDQNGSSEPQPVSKKDAVKGAHKEVGKQPKGETGKFGSPMRGNSTKGYRLDPPNPRGKGLERTHRHVNWWDYSKGKRKSGQGRKGYIPIKDK